MKFDKNDKYVKIAILVSICAVLVYTSCSVVWFIPSIFMKAVHLLKYMLNLITPVIVAFAIAYLLLIPTRAIEEFLMSRKHLKKKNRAACRAIGVIITYASVLGIIVATVVGIYFMIGGQISKSTTFNNMYNSITEYFKNGTISVDSLQAQLEKLNLPNIDVISSKLATFATTLSDVFSNIISLLFGTIISLGGNIFNLLISIILSIYFIMSHEYFTKCINKFFYVIFRESRLGERIRRYFTIINETFSSYIRGQLIEAFIVAVLSSIALTLAKVDYAIVIGVIAGICNLVPYVGPLVGTVLAGIIGLLGGDILTCVWAVVGMQIVQQLDANIICPRVVGNIVGLHGAFVIIAILIGGNYAGLLGMLLAVPVAASLKTIVGEWFDSHFPNFESHYSGIVADSDIRHSEKKEEHSIHKAEKRASRNFHKKSSPNNIDK